MTVSEFVIFPDVITWKNENNIILGSVEGSDFIGYVTESKVKISEVKCKICDIIMKCSWKSAVFCINIILCIS